MLFHSVIDVPKANIAFVSNKWNLIWLDNFSLMFGADLLLGIADMIRKSWLICSIVWEMGNKYDLGMKKS